MATAQGLNKGSAAAAMRHRSFTAATSSPLMGSWLGGKVRFSMAPAILTYRQSGGPLVAVKAVGRRGGRSPAQPAPPQPPPAQQQYAPPQYAEAPSPQYPPPQQQYAPPGQPQQYSTSNGPQTDLSYLATASVEDKWQHYLDNPDLWWDNRLSKRNPRGPDFKLKSRDVEVPLWLTSKDTPDFVRQRFGIPPNAQGSAGGTKYVALSPEEAQHLATAATINEKWEHFIANPGQWYDQRETRINPKAPDFKLKSKEVNVALWLTSKDTPDWVRQQFGVPAPTGRSGAGSGPRVDTSHVAQMSTADKWQHLKDNPGAWFDNHATKTNPKAPDFKLKNNAVNVVLWLTSKDTPEWAREQWGVPAQSAQPAQPGGDGAGRGRGGQPRGTTPDLSYLVNGVAEDRWQHLRDNSDMWWDNRTTKRSEKGPDFKLKSKDVNVALWLTSSDTPAWAREMYGQPAQE